MGRRSPGVRRYGHLPGEELGDMAAAAVQRLQGQRRDGCDDRPREHVSGGDVVMNDALIAEYRKWWPKLVGIEMEAGGAERLSDCFAARTFKRGGPLRGSFRDSRQKTDLRLSPITPAMMPSCVRLPVHR